jgi:hypothetical protein
MVWCPIHVSLMHAVEDHVRLAGAFAELATNTTSLSVVASPHSTTLYWQSINCAYGKTSTVTP